MTSDWPPLSRLEEIAAWAASAHWSSLIPWDARWQAAWDGMTEEVAGGGIHLHGAALHGINRAVDAEKHHHGLAAGRTGTGARFQVYWRGRPDGFAEVIEDKIALTQIWPSLTASHQAALGALADTDGDIRLAADLIGVRYGAFRSMISLARYHCRELWFAPESPARYYQRHSKRKEPSHAS